MRNTRVRGHGLQGEGAPYVGEGLAEVAGPLRMNHYDWLGVALCSCGWRSEVLESNGQRKRAYNQHKADVLAAVSGD